MLKQRKNFINSCILLFGMLNLPINASTTHQTAYIDIYKNAVNAVVTIIVVAENSSGKELLNTIPKDSPFNKLFEEEGEQVVPKMY